MTCSVCGQKSVLHGSALARQLPDGGTGTYLSESGCHNGVWMDDDEYAEGWQPDVIYRPCPNHPKCCKKCGGSGELRDKDGSSYDCTNKTCNAGWKGTHEYPDNRYAAGER